MLGGSELRELLISWVVLSFCFSFTPNLTALAFFLPVALITVGSGFIVHELSHRFVAQRMGCMARYRMWNWGLMLALFTSIFTMGRMVFAAPGAVYISYPINAYYIGENRVRKAEGLISMSGPMANIALALLFYALSRLGGLAGIIGLNGLSVNAFLAFFNLLPFPPLDGWKVLRSNVLTWIALIAVSGFLTFYF